MDMCAESGTLPSATIVRALSSSLASFTSHSQAAAATRTNAATNCVTTPDIESSLPHVCSAATRTPRSSRAISPSPSLTTRMPLNLAPLTDRSTLASVSAPESPIAVQSSPGKPRGRAASRKRVASRTTRSRRGKVLHGRAHSKRRSKADKKRPSHSRSLLSSLSMKPKYKRRSHNLTAGSHSSSTRAPRFSARPSYIPLSASNQLKRQPPLRSPSELSSDENSRSSISDSKKQIDGESTNEGSDLTPTVDLVAANNESDIMMESPSSGAPPESVDIPSFTPRKVLKRPKLSNSLSVSQRLEKIQNFIENFQYNSDNRAMFISKSRPLSSITECADQIIRKSSPIKCMEAAVLGIFLTNDIEKLTRLCLRFKSTVDGRTYWHIVLCVRFRNKFGTLGLSRKSELAFKPIQYSSLFDLVSEFRRCYVEECGHVVHRVTVGLPVGQSSFSKESIHWQYLQLPLDVQFVATESGLLREVLDSYISRCWDIKYALDYGAPIPVIHPDLEATREVMQLRSKDLRDLRKESQTLLIDRADRRQRRQLCRDARRQLKHSARARTSSFLLAHSRSRSLSPQKTTNHKKSRFSCPRVNVRTHTKVVSGTSASRRRKTSHLEKVSLPVVLPPVGTQKVDTLKVS